MRILTVFLCVGYLLAAASRATAADPKEDVPSLLKALKSSDPKKRIYAADELGHLGSIQSSDTKDAVEPLIKLIKKDGNADVRKAAATALGKIDPDPETAVPALKDALKDKKAAVRIAAANALGQIGPEAKDAISALEEAQKDKNKDVSRAARNAIRSINGTKKKG